MKLGGLRGKVRPPSEPSASCVPEVSAVYLVSRRTLNASTLADYGGDVMRLCGRYECFLFCVHSCNIYLFLSSIYNDFIKIQFS